MSDSEDDFELLNDYARELEEKLETRDKEMTELLEASEELIKENAQYAEEKAEMQREHSREVNQLTEEIGWLKTQNEKLQAQLRKVEMNATVRRPKQATPASRTMGATISKEQKGTNEPGQLKRLTLRQVTDLIDDIYESKKKYDAKVEQGGQPPETMEQHIYTFLNHRYGLRQLVVDWAHSIKRAIAEHETADNDVAVFARIVRNEIDEQFRQVLNDLKATVQELLRVVLAQKMGTKPVSDAVTAKLKAKMSGTLLEDEWVDIVKYMYRDDDALAVIVQVKTMINEAHRPRADGRKTKVRMRIPYGLLVKALLDFQLQGHDRFLLKFRSLFRQYDSDSNGVLTRAEFRDLFRTLTAGSVDLEKTVDEADPYGHDVITFSRAVSVLAGQLVNAAKIE